jgi:murein tripeptide amidase MpaA
MSIIVSSAFDSGNIKLIKAEGSVLDLEINQDAHSDFYQWFHFRLSGVRDQALTLRVTNCANAAYPMGWPGYQARVSTDRETWVQAETSYDNGVLTIDVEVDSDILWVAYFAPYSMERHHDLVAAIAEIDGVRHRTLGQSLDGQPIDCLTIGEGPLTVWLYARHEPRRIGARASAHQCRGREPQPRMARPLRRTQPRSALRPQCDGRAEASVRDGHPRRRSDCRQLPRRL